MSLNTDVTLRRLIHEISQWADSHKMVDRFGYGDFLQIYEDSENTYPYMMVNCSDASLSKFYIKFNLEICIMDWVWDNRENHDRVESDTMEILRDFQNTIEESPRWDSFSKLNGDINARKFVERGGDKVTGWCGTFNLWIRRNSGFCDLEAIMPEYDFQSQESIVVADPSCPTSPISINGVFQTNLTCGEPFNAVIETIDPEDATVRNSNSSFSESIESGGELILDDVEFIISINGEIEETLNFPAQEDTTINININYE